MFKGKLSGASPGTVDQMPSESKSNMKLANRIRKHAEAHPNDNRAQEIVAKLDAIRAGFLKE